MRIMALPTETEFVRDIKRMFSSRLRDTLETCQIQ